MHAKWGWALQRDPYFNPNLSLRDLSISLAFPPAIHKPWRQNASEPRWDEVSAEQAGWASR
jgi:hypothetical protein